MNKTKIDWCDSTWNPITGCLHECEYCYAREMANRFKLESWEYCTSLPDFIGDYQDSRNYYLHDLLEPILNNVPFQSDNFKKEPYPYAFEPTFHRYRLDDYKNKKGRTIFVGSMSDLFGDWVPDKWIKAVFDACEKAPQHRYLFLTKNPRRMHSFSLRPHLNITDNMWFGFSATNKVMFEELALDVRGLPENTFVSIEPLHGLIDLTKIEPTGKDAYLNFTTGGQYWLKGGNMNGKRLKWVIIGAETGKRKDKIVPERNWIEKIMSDCKKENIPVFMKNSLADIWGEPLIQEFPWDV